MRIWTTPYLNSLLQLPDLPARLVSDREVRRAYLVSAERDDVAIVAFDDTYREFLAAVRTRGITGPVVFISPEPTMIEAGLRDANVLVLDVKRSGIAAVRDIVRFLLFVAQHYATSVMPVAGTDGLPSARSEDRPVEAASAVMERLRYAVEMAVPVIAAINIHEDGEPVTARGGCVIKGIENGVMALDRFKQALLNSSMKPGMTATLYFPYKQENQSALVTIVNTTEKAVFTTVPERLFPTREMRIQPNPAKPVTLYVLIPNEPTHALDVFDISPRGIGFMCSRDLPVDTSFGFTILLPDPSALVLTAGVIRFKKEGAYGIRYGAEIRPHPWDSESIAKYIMKRDAEIIGLLRNR